jgi:tape measure domain-containing protein
MATERVQVIVTSKGTVTVKREIEAIGDSAKKSAGGLDLLKGALAGLSVGYLANEFIQYSDSALRLSNSLELAGLSGQAFTDTQERIYGAAIKNGQAAEDLAVVYRKISEVSDQLKISQGEVIGTTEGIAAAMKLSTAGTAAQSGALQQLGQLLGGNMVQAQEYNSLIDGAYPLLQAAANGSREWGGSVAQLTQDVKNSEVSVKQFFDALTIGLQDTQKLAATVPLTIGQSFVALRQSFQEWIATSTEASIVSRTFAAAIQGLAANMNVVAPIVVTLAGVITAALVGSAITGAISAIGILSTSFVRLGSVLVAVVPQVIAFGVALVANPITLWAAAIVAATAALAAFVVYLFQGEEGLTNLAAKAEETVSQIKDYFDDLFIFNGGDNKADIQFRGEQAANDLRAAGADIGKQIKAAAAGANLGKEIEKGADKGGEKFKKDIEKGSENGAKQFDKAGTDNAAKMGTTFAQAADKQTNINDVFVAKFEGTGRNIYDLWNNWGNSFIDSFGTTIGSLLIDYQNALTDNLKAQAQLFKEQAAQLKLQNEYLDKHGEMPGTSSGYGNSGNGNNGNNNNSATTTDTFSGFFKKGGDVRVGGSGGSDSQLVKLRATPNETIRVMTPEQRQAEQRTAQAVPTQQAPPPTVINLFDPSAILAAMQTAEGRDTMMNVVKANREEFAGILGVA